MATSRLIKKHIDDGSTILASIAKSIDYGNNPTKTRNGELLSYYECDPRTAVSEFMLAKEEYTILTGRTQDKDKDVLLYQIRQSFKPGEISPEDANRLAYELAIRFTKGKHAFLVCTHEDKKHIHSHIYFNSTKLDHSGKFRDFLGSGRAVRRLSDQICVEHSFSIIEKPKRRGVHYGTWLGDDKKPSWQDKLRWAIDDALKQQPADFDAFLALMEQAGYEVKQGKRLAFRAGGQTNFTRCDTLKGDHTVQAIQERIGGRPPLSAGSALEQSGMAKGGRLNLLVDIQAKIQAGKGPGFERWAKLFNIKQAAQTLLYLQENGIDDYALLEEKAARATARFHELSGRMNEADGRMKEITSLQKHISNYRRTRDVYVQYRKAGYSKKFLAEHEREILLHKAAKQAFDDLQLQKIPSIKTLQQEYAVLQTDKNKMYSEYRQAKAEMREVLTAKANADHLLGNAPERQNRSEHQR